MRARRPSRDDAGTTPASTASRCPVCAAPFTPAGTRRHEHTVYECPDCGERRLGVQRCTDCGTFGRSAGLGGSCPHCGEPVTVADLELTKAGTR